jgi:hypothetical protein
MVRAAVLDAVEKAGGEAAVTMAVGRRGAFEVTVNDSHLAFSKLATYSFPDTRSLAADVAAFCKDGKVPSTWGGVAGGRREGFFGAW